MSEPSVAEQVAQNLTDVRARIDATARAAGRAPEAVRLVAVSKRQPEARIDAALAAGQRVFGEIRVQEAEAHWRARREAVPDLELHMIGPLQTNKVKEAVRLFDVIETVDRPKLAQNLAAEMERTGRRLPCFIEVNVGEEPQKAGVWPEEADALVRRCRDELDLPLAGLMCIPPFGEEPAPYFALLRTIAERNGLIELSMGMSDDYEVAIGLGANVVRVGTAIFGERESG